MTTSERFAWASRDFMAADRAITKLRVGFHELRESDIHQAVGQMCRFDNPEEPSTWCDACKEYDWNARDKLLRHRYNAKQRMRTAYEQIISGGLG